MSRIIIDVIPNLGDGPVEQITLLLPESEYCLFDKINNRKIEVNSIQAKRVSVE